MFDGSIKMVQYIKIGDFGLAKKTDRTDPNIDFGSYGNAIYLAPEQHNNGICNKKSDIFSLGIIFLELIILFSTTMEKIAVIKQFKEQNYTSLMTYKNSNDVELIMMMLKEDYTKRANIKTVKNFFKNYVYKEGTNY